MKSLEQQQNAVPFIETEHWREAYHAPKKETPISSELTFQELLERALDAADVLQNVTQERDELRRRLDAVSLRADRIRCELVKAAKENANPPAIIVPPPSEEIEAMREAIKAANEGLYSAMQYILSLPYFGNLEELETTEKVQSALAKLKPFLP